MPETITVGKLLLQEGLPADLHSHLDKPLDAKGLSSLFEKLSEKESSVYKASVNKLSRLGFEVSTREGSSIGLHDLLSPVDKHKYFSEVEEKVNQINKSKDSESDKKHKIAELYHKLSDDLNKAIIEEGLKNDHTLAKIIVSGSRGSPTQYRQTVAAPVMVPDRNGAPNINLPIKKSYAEGLSLPEYLASSFGARAGSVATKLSTADAGYASKQISRASMTIKVEEHDCGTDNGIPVSTSDKDSIGSFLARAVSGFNKNNEVTFKLLSELQGKKVDTVIVRSPITCQSSRTFHSGSVCQLCVGRRERGIPHIGDYVGITAATTLGERLSQGQLSTKHSSGSAQKVTAATGFKLVNQLFNIPKTFQAKAAVAFHDGEITKIEEPSHGGHNIFVGHEEHYVGPGLDVKVKVGDKVEAGDVLSEGVVNPAEMVKYKGIGEGRRQFATIMHKAFKDSGMPVNRRNFEVISKGAIDHVRITHPEGLGDYLPNQIVSYQAIEKDYKPRPNSKDVIVDKAYNTYLEQPVLHHTIGTRMTKSVIADLKKHNIEHVIVNPDPPHFEPEMQRLLDVPAHEHDWMHQLYSTNLEKRFRDAVNQGMISNINGPSPVPGLAYGIGFGDKPDTKS